MTMRLLSELNSRLLEGLEAGRCRERREFLSLYCASGSRFGRSVVLAPSDGRTIGTMAPLDPTMRSLRALHVLQFSQPFRFFSTLRAILFTSGVNLV